MMKCENCGHEIAEGSIYCDFCGKEVQIVPDYNLLDDEILAEMLEDPKEKEKRLLEDAKKRAAEEEAKRREEERLRKAEEEKKAAEERKKKQKRITIIAVVAAVVLVAAGVGAYVFLHSYGHYMANGASLDAAEEYKQAIGAYERALAARQGDTDATVAIANDYYLLGEYDEAEQLLAALISDNPDAVEAYRLLLTVYSATGDYGKIEMLKAGATDSAVQSLFTDFVLDTVSFSVAGGKYADDVELTLENASDYDMYYTTDGTTPSRDHGTYYSTPFTLKDGTTTVTAVCVDDNGRAGRATEETYDIKYEPPDYPTVTPSSGVFTTETLITMTAKEGASIYYTWDGTIPTSSSAKYEAPIAIPEGNNILAVLVVDKHGLNSDILRLNYTYLPSPAAEEAVE